MAQHLLVAADRFQLIRLRGICEQRLCVSIEEETVATTLALAEQNNALELKRVCLEYVALHLKKVLHSCVRSGCLCVRAFCRVFSGVAVGLLVGGDGSAPGI